ncbi:hypothetical protein [Pseudomonas aeruginosa]|uniref:hypothetical protein n=1 Tax=Pseudomonas aeruginosa TaxID=287 RepID=UPI001FD768CE|nr:hypothetical protein [Pseudomonas aeruginosa]
MDDRYGSPAWWSAAAPQTASGITFITLEDEFGMVNVWSDTTLPNGRGAPFLESRLLQVEGILESSGECATSSPGACMT